MTDASDLASPARAGMYLLAKHCPILGPSFPRTRGDVPIITLLPMRTCQLPPHARGCTRRIGRGRRSQVASPARAGMYRRCESSAEARSSFPRTRGDVPGWRKPFGKCERLPPHARGCTLSSVTGHAPDNASPARAGMYRSIRHDRRIRPRFPRTRGDVPWCSSLSRRSRWLPPHARGCTLRRACGRARHLASPARAGMYPTPQTGVPGRSGFPRTRGDVPSPFGAFSGGRWLPPHARGCTPRRRHRGRSGDASPARAGMYRPAPSARKSSRGFPRTRGDVPPSMAAPGKRRPLPPHARGCTPALEGELPGPPASPARAGMYLSRYWGRAGRLSFPRTRGDVPTRRLSRRCSLRLPPHARGCTRRRAHPAC